VLHTLGIDLRYPRQPYLGRRWPGAPMELAGSVGGAPPVHNRACAYDEICEHPLSGLQDAAELARYPWPRPEWRDANGLQQQIKELDAGGSYAIALEEFCDPGGFRDRLVPARDGAVPPCALVG
jgi:hypothetical protein